VKTLEELGIGRPSTYASIISTIQDRGYVRLEDKRFFPEDVAEVVTDKLVEHFADVVDVNFTARMEEELDEIAEGGSRRSAVLREFWVPFSEDLSRAEEKFERYVEELDEECPRCIEEGRVPPGRLQIRLGRYGPFVGCSGYPDCRYIKKDPPRSLEITCPQCNQGEIVEKRTRFGLFYGCDRYPECDFAVSNPPVKDHPCPECGSILLERPKSYRCWNCGAELDKEFNVHKHGDLEAEAAARAAKSAARAARQRSKGAKTAAKRTSAQRSTAKRSAVKRAGARKSSGGSTASGNGDAPAAAEG
jgi:DNA topoisomerase-1